MYATYAKGASERYTNRILASLPDARVDVLAEEAPAVVSAEDPGKPSFAAVVAGATSRLIVQKTATGDTAICHVPRSPPNKKYSARPPTDNSSSAAKADSSNGRKPKTKVGSYAVADLFVFVKRVWPIVRQQLQPFFDGNPWIEKLIDVLTSDAVLNLLQPKLEDLSTCLQHA